MRPLLKKETATQGTNRHFPGNPPGIKIIRTHGGRMEKILLALIAACLFLMVVLAMRG